MKTINAKIIPLSVVITRISRKSSGVNMIIYFSAISSQVFNRAKIHIIKAGVVIAGDNIGDIKVIKYMATPRTKKISPIMIKKAEEIFREVQKKLFKDSIIKHLPL